MRVTEAVQARRSVRAFKSRPVDDGLIREIFALAQHAPSGCNSQPWHVNVVSGAARGRLEQALIDEVTSGAGRAPDFGDGQANFAGALRERQVACGSQLYRSLGIERHDREGRNRFHLQNWRFFGAPHAAIISTPKYLGPQNVLDVGIYLQTVMMLMTERGVSSCPQGSLAFYPRPIFELLRIPEGYGVVCGLSFGYPDEDAAVNRFDVGRATVTECVDFLSE